MQRFRAKASRNAALDVSVSARALNIRDPTFAASAQCGIRPHRYAAIARRSSRWTTTWASSVGATLKRAPRSSPSGSAAKISASSDAGRCWLNRPHMAASLSARPVSSAAMDEPTVTPPVPDRHASGPLSREAAGQLLDHGAALIGAGDYPEAFATYQRVVGFDDPEITAAALLGVAQAAYRLDDEAFAIRTWERVLELPETRATYQAWREIAAARVREGDLQGAIGAYREADRRAPAADKPEISNRLGWLAKETGNVRASRRYFARGRGTGLPYVTYAIIGVTVVVSLTAMLSTEGSSIFEVLQLDKR